MRRTLYIAPGGARSSDRAAVRAGGATPGIRAVNSNPRQRLEPAVRTMSNRAQEARWPRPATPRPSDILIVAPGTNCAAAPHVGVTLNSTWPTIVYSVASICPRCKIMRVRAACAHGCCLRHSGRARACGRPFRSSAHRNPTAPALESIPHAPGYSHANPAAERQGAGYEFAPQRYARVRASVVGVGCDYYAPGRSSKRAGSTDEYARQEVAAARATRLGLARALSRIAAAASICAAARPGLLGSKYVVRFLHHRRHVNLYQALSPAMECARAGSRYARDAGSTATASVA